MNTAQLVAQAQAISQELAAMKGAQPLGQPELSKHSSQQSMTVSIGAGTQAVLRSHFTPVAGVSTKASCIAWANTTLPIADFREITDPNAVQQQIITVSNPTQDSVTVTVTVNWFSNFTGSTDLVRVQ